MKEQSPLLEPASRRTLPPWSACLAAAGVVGILGACKPAEKTGEEPNPSAPVSFVSDIKPLLESRCLSCHNTSTLLGRLNLENRELAFSHPEGGQFIVPGEPKSSKMYQVLLLPRDDDEAMPAIGHRLSEEEVDLMRRWIEQGAEWPDGPDGVLVPIIPPEATE